MNLWNKSELLEALKDQLIEHNLEKDFSIDEVVIDSRKTPRSGLFIALKGEKNDAHDFIEQAFKNGCAVALVHDQKVYAKLHPNFNLILVKDTFAALYELAKFSRQRSKAKIIAVTGSVGKTGTKEMLKLAFSAYGKTYATIGNLNNHFGLPLTLCNFARDCEFGIFEMGMNHLHEIEPLSKLAQPHLAVITTVGPVHIENFKNEQEIALAKSEIFAGLTEDGVAVINRDNHHFDFIAGIAKKFVSFGTDKKSDYCLESFKIKDADSSEVFVKIKNEVSYKISSTSKTTIFNSLIIVAALDLLTDDLTKGLQTLANIESTAGRGKAIELEFDHKKITIIDDSYNASVLSMRAGIEHAVELKNALNKKRVVAAVGDMLELGEKSVELHEEVANYLAQFHIDFAVMVGEKMTNAAKKLPANSYKTFPDSTAAALEIKGLLKDGDILYVKGSRGTKMEKIIEILTNQKSAH